MPLVWQNSVDTAIRKDTQANQGKSYQAEHNADSRQQLYDSLYSFNPHDAHGSLQSSGYFKATTQNEGEDNSKPHPSLQNGYRAMSQTLSLGADLFLAKDGSETLANNYPNSLTQLDPDTFTT